MLLASHMLDEPIMENDSKFWLNKGDSWVTTFGEQSICVIGLIRFRGFMCLMVLVAILALTHIGDHFDFVVIPILCDGMKCE